MPRKNEPLERQCALTREVRPVSELMRFVMDPDGNVMPDFRRNLPGRGVWITASKEALDLAEKRRVFPKAFKAEAKVEPGLSARVDAMLVRSALSALSLARKAGELVTGFAKVDAALKRDPVVGLIHASDASEDGVRKLAGLFASRFEDTNGGPVVRLFDSTQLDLALGRSNVIHAALLAGRASGGFLARLRDLEAFRAGSVAKDSDGANSVAGQD
ncbi:RNA-binding protein [Pannonibacter carbonis]|uniref:RNA-binding protein n=1 Tax=Pannonibacter carbonis TaxID=2067569 RepID=UPI000D108F6C|nr:RNA-binding protein [Pannonibacter carbonis]